MFVTLMTAPGYLPEQVGLVPTEDEVEAAAAVEWELAA